MMANHWPLGLDILRTIIKADGDGHLMENFFGFHGKMGWTFSSNLLGAKSWGTVEPRNLEVMMGSKFEEWGLGPRRPIMFPVVGEGIFIQEGPAWKHSREVLRPQFAYGQYDDMGIFEEAVEDLFEAIEKEVEKGGVVELQGLFFKLTLDTTTAFLFGESVKSLLDMEEGEVGEQNFAQAFNTAQTYIQQRFRLGDFYWVAGGKKFKAACKSINDFTDRLIERGLGREKKKVLKEGEKGQYVFLDTVAEKVQDKDELRGQAINILAAGRDTTAALLSWVL
jgi:cytochrome P450